MKVLLRHPSREIELDGFTSIDALLQHLGVNPESVLVIRNDELVPRATRLQETDVVEIRPVISGG